MLRKSQISLTLATAGLVALAGCNSSSSGDGTGSLSLGISDGPVHDANKVCIAFTGVELKPKDGPSFVIDTGLQNINLLDFQGANAAPFVFSEPVDAGEYVWLRLLVNAARGGTGGTGNDTSTSNCQGDASYLATADGRVYNLYIPSGAQTGLKLINEIVVPNGGSADFTADIDLMQSLVEPMGLEPDLMFKPVVRLVDNLEVGTLTGTVTDSTEIPVSDSTACPAPSVYLFADGVTPNAITADGTDENDPIATAKVALQDNGGDPATWNYSIGFLIAGSYEAAFTCDGETFVPADGKPAEIGAGGVTTVDF